METGHKHTLSFFFFFFCVLSVSEDCVVLYDRVIHELGFGLSWPGVTKENCDKPWNS